MYIETRRGTACGEKKGSGGISFGRGRQTIRLRDTIGRSALANSDGQQQQFGYSQGIMFKIPWGSSVRESRVWLSGPSIVASG